MTDRPMCDTCKFCAAAFTLSGEGGQCRRYPPKVFDRPDQAMALWPEVDFTDWCGEYQQTPWKKMDGP